MCMCPRFGGRNPTTHNYHHRHTCAGWGRLVIATANQVHVFSAPHWATPAIADVRETSVLLLQCERAIALVDCCGTVSVFTYEGRPLSSLRPPGLLASRPGRHALSLASDTLAVAAGTSVTCFEIPQGQPLGGSYTHSCPVKAISLSQVGMGACVVYGHVLGCVLVAVAHSRVICVLGVLRAAACSRCCSCICCFCWCWCCCCCCGCCNMWGLRQCERQHHSPTAPSCNCLWS